MISLAGRDILHAWGKFVFTGIGLGLLIGVTLIMAGVYRFLVSEYASAGAGTGSGRHESGTRPAVIGTRQC